MKQQQIDNRQQALAKCNSKNNSSLIGYIQFCRINFMSKNTPKEADYTNLKQQYDSLLQKNQNDLIKIKLKQKALNDQIAQLQQEHEEQQKNLKIQIQQLTSQIAKNKKNDNQQIGNLVVDISNKESSRIESLEIDVRRLMDQNILLTAENTDFKANIAIEKQKNQQSQQLITDLRTFIQTLQNKLNQKTVQLQSNIPLHKSDDYTMTQVNLNTQRQIDERKKRQIENLTTSIERQKKKASQLQITVKQMHEQMSKIIEKERRTFQLLRKKDAQTNALMNQLQKMKQIVKGKKKKTQTTESECHKCSQLKQEAQLLRQMVRSSNVMVRVKSIEVEKYRMLTEDQQNLMKQNKSTAKYDHKFPPLKKK